MTKGGRPNVPQVPGEEWSFYASMTQVDGARGLSPIGPISEWAGPVTDRCII